MRRLVSLACLLVGLSVVPPAHAVPCHPTVVRLVDRLSALNTRLDDGMNYYAYAAAVQNVRVAYDRIPVNRLSPGCVRLVGVPAEKAMNRYITARVVWAKYAPKGLAVPAKEKSRIQKLWAQANGFIRQAVRNLD